MPFCGAGSVFSCGEETVGETARLSGKQDGGAPPHLQKSRGGAQASGCPNSSGSVHLPIHPEARTGTDPRPRPGLTAGSGKGWLCHCHRLNFKCRCQHPPPARGCPGVGTLAQMGWETHEPPRYSLLVLNSPQPETPLRCRMGHCCEEKRWERLKTAAWRRGCGAPSITSRAPALPSPGSRRELLPWLQGDASRGQPRALLPPPPPACQLRHSTPSRFAPWRLGQP